MATGKASSFFDLSPIAFAARTTAYHLQRLRADQGERHEQQLECGKPVMKHCRSIPEKDMQNLTAFFFVCRSPSRSVLGTRVPDSVVTSDAPQQEAASVRLERLNRRQTPCCDWATGQRRSIAPQLSSDFRSAARNLR